MEQANPTEAARQQGRGGTLPSINQLGLPWERTGHQYNPPHQVTSFATLPLRPTVHTQWRGEAINYPPSPSTTTASESPTGTPMLSHRTTGAAAVSRSQGRRRKADRRQSNRSSVISNRTRKPSGSTSGESDAELVDGPADKKVTDKVKTVKERGARKEFSTIDADAEDSNSFYVGFEAEKPQTASNGTSSGLFRDKWQNRCAQLSLLAHLLHKELERAYYEDIVVRPDAQYPAVARFREGTNAFMHQAASNGNVLTGTFLEDDADEGLCDHEGKSKPCTVHRGEPHSEDFRSCRRHRRERKFHAGVEQLKARLRQERLALERARGRL